MEENGFEFKNAANQYIATIAANLIMTGHGAVIGWFSPSLPLLLSDDTPLVSGPLNNEELSWLGSINNLGALGGILTFGFVTTIVGCKMAMLFLAFPSAAFWLIIFFGNTYYHILFGRFLAGWTGGGIQATIVLYISEIANDNVRGRLSSLSTLSRNIGVLIIFIVGAVVEYRYIPCIFIFFPIIYLFFFMLLPNTPQFYLRRNQIQEAQDSLKYYKSYKGETQLEIDAFNVEFERLKALEKERKEDNGTRISDFFEKKAVKGILIGIVLGWWAQFPGSLTFLNYGVLIFEEAGASQMDSYTSSVMLAIAQILGCLLSTQLADSLGRKLLMIVSFMGSAVPLFVLSVFLYLTRIGYDLHAYSWLPVVCLSTVMFISAAGVYSVYSVCFVEILPSKVRTIGLTICVLFMYASAFVFIKLFPIFLETFDLYGTMIIYFLGCLIGTFFVLFCIEETKGKSLDTLRAADNKS